MNKRKTYRLVYDLVEISCQVFEYVNNTDFKTLYPTFEEGDVQHYIYQLLKVSEIYPGFLGLTNHR